MLKQKFIIFLLLFSSIYFSEFIFYSSNNFENNFENKFSINIMYSFSNWSNGFVVFHGDGNGYPTNPAENVFYLFDNIKPFFEISLFYNFQNLVLYTNIPFQKEIISKVKDPSTNFFLVDEKPTFDMNGPENFLLGYISDNIFLAIGRFPLHWGDSKYPISISDTTFQDNITFSTKNNFFKYTYHLISSYPLLSSYEQEVQRKYFEKHTPSTNFFEPVKTIAAHRFDFFIDNFRIGIGEINVVGGKIPDIIDINPLMFFHNTYGEGYSNVLSSIDFNVKVSNISIYGEFCLDDINGPTEVGTNYKPDAYGYNFGMFLDYKPFNVWIEYDFTSEWMYITNYLPYLRVNVRHFYIDNNNNNNSFPSRSLMDYPLGFRYGPDATMISLGFSFSKSNFKVTTEFNFLVKGMVIDDSNGKIRWKWFWDSWSGNVNPTPESSVINTFDQVYNIFSIEFSYKFLSLKSLFVDKNYFISLQVNF